MPTLVLDQEMQPLGIPSILDKGCIATEPGSLCNMARNPAQYTSRSLRLKRTRKQALSA